MEAAEGLGVDGYADGADGDVEGAAATFGDASEIVLYGQQSFSFAHGRVLRGSCPAASCKLLTSRNIGQEWSDINGKSANPLISWVGGGFCGLEAGNAS